MQKVNSINKHEILLTGKPFSALLWFSIPFIIGDFCQQMYNAIDSMIVGNFVGENALAALGVASPLMSIMTYLLMGLAMGAGVVISQHYGAGNYDDIKRINSTALLIGCIITVVLSALFIGVTKPVLYLLSTPQVLVADTCQYLYIIFAGGIFCFLYNYYCYALRSIGKSLLPLVFLLISVAVNAALDLLFVIVFNMGVIGAGLATIIAQAVSVTCCIIYTENKIKLLSLRPSDLVIDKRFVRPVLSYGFSFAIQQVYVYVGRMFIQGVVNKYDTSVIAGINACYKVDSIIQTPVRGYTNAFTTYCAQNYGHNDIARVKQGYKATWLFMWVYALVSFLVGFFLARPLAGMFVSDDAVAVIDVGSTAIKYMAVGYIFTFLIFQSQALFKGIGMLKTFFSITVMSITCRVGFSFLFEHFMGLDGLYLAIPSSWFMGGMFGLIAVAIVMKKKFGKQRLQASATSGADSQCADSETTAIVSQPPAIENDGDKQELSSCEEDGQPDDEVISKADTDNRV
ncbi:MAG: MATE family efflux transporter [Christensenellales bacterium]